MSVIKINSTYARQAKFFGLDRDHIIPMFAIACVSGAICLVFTEWGEVPFAAMTFGGSAAWLLYAGNDVRGAIEAFIFPGPEWAISPMPFAPITEPGTRKRIKVKPIMKAPTAAGKAQNFRNFHSYNTLHALVEFEAEGETFAAYLNCYKGKWQVVLPFSFVGLHSEMDEAEAEISAKLISAAMRELPLGARLQFRMGAYDRPHEWLHATKDIAAKQVTPLTSMLAYNQCNRVRDLSATGSRQVLVQQAFITFDLGIGADAPSPVDRLAEGIASALRKVLDTQGDHQELTYKDMAAQIYERVYLPWRYLLENKTGLQLQTWGLQEAWFDLYRRFVRADRTEAIPDLPNWLTFRKQGEVWKIGIEGDRDRDALSVLLSGAAGEPTVPQHLNSRDMVWVADRYVGACALERAPQQFESAHDQLSWVFRTCFGRPFSHEMEYFVEIEPEDVAAARENLTRLSKQSYQQAYYSIEDGKGEGVEALEEGAEVKDARLNLHRGHLPLKVAVTILLHRRTPEILDRDALQLCRSFGSAGVARERQTCHRLWLETLPITPWGLQTSTDLITQRRLRLDSAAIGGFFPLMAPRTIHETGLEFLGEAGLPLYINFSGSPTNAIISGSKGSGKSVLLSGIATDAIKRGIPAIAVDFSLGGISTFKILAEFLGEHGAYLNLATESFNILQPPDFSRVAENRRTREQRWLEFLQQVLEAICLHSVDKPQLRQVVKLAIQRLLKVFYTDPVIDRRIQDAFTGGWGSADWKKMPVLQDMLPFLIPGRLEMDGSNPTHREAVDWIGLQLQGILDDPELNHALCRPSTIPPEPLFRVFALSGLGSEGNAFIISLVAQMACIQQALSYPRSLILMDEANRLLEKPGFAQLVATIFSTFRKEGVSALLSGQDIGTLTRSQFWSSITANVDFMLTGRQSSGAVNDYVDHLGYPCEMIRRNATEDFKARRSDRSTAWLIEQAGRFWAARYYPADQLLAAVANDQLELAARKRVFERHETRETLGQLRALSDFASTYVRVLSAGESMETIQ